MIGSIILTPILVAIGLFIIAGLFQLLVLLLVRPANAGFEATFRVVSYASVVQLISWIPIVNFLAYVYFVILSVFGIREAHSTSTGTAAIVVLIPVGVLLLLVVILGAALALLLYSLLGTQQF